MQAAWLSMALIVCCRQAPVPAKAVNDYPIKPVDFTAVKLEDEFWAPRLERNRTVTIPYLFRANEETGRVDNFRIAAGLKKGKHTGKRYNDSDVFKAMEAAAYSLRTHPDPALREKLDELVAVIGKAQEPDGYLFTTRTIDPENPAPGAGKERWSNLRVSHELYNVGHMYEAAVAHYAATGERTFLDVAVKNADLLVNTFGPGRRRAFPGHQEIEIGLGKLYRVTGNAQYLGLARFFLDERGRYYGGDRYPSDSPFVIYNSEEYLQNHRPALEQTEAVGHAVRATYMYSGMADVAALAGRPEYASAAGIIWENVIGKKLYLTGGIGSSGEYEAFGPEYELPNARAYAETCASVGNALWSQRMFQLYGDAKYIDILERIVYNGLISGISLGGDRFFYQNPLESAGRYERSAWFEVACCPANVARFLPTLPGYVYAAGKNTLYVNLYAAGTARFDVDGRPVEVTQETKYPWEGRVRILVNPRPPRKFTAMLRIPGWALNRPVPTELYRFLDKGEQPVRLWINRKPVEFEIENGYIRLSRKWRSNDLVELILPMPSRRVVADERVREDEGKVALERGPVVFCAEGVDNGGRVLNLVLPDDARVEYWQRPDLLGGVAILTAKAAAVEKDAEGRVVNRKPHDLMAVPYFAWANRGPGEMVVWLPRTESAVKPRPKL
ncbi:MAG: glycoside hydrolase family 127 protein [Candidatus Aminicenantes bacterium]|nr:glycoside hydrolase family 127 protein [Candidatus Aminicenantes bacterium]